MKGPIYALAFLALLAMASSLKKCPKVDGQWAVSVANPADCKTYYACSSGTPVLANCPSGLLYNEELGVCDWPEHAHCVPTTSSSDNE